MSNSGLGETRINNLLAAVNMPIIHQKTLKRRERDAGRRIQKLTEIAIAEALREKVEKSK